MRALIVSNDDHFACWTAASLSRAGMDVHVMASRSWGGTRLSRHCQAYSTFGRLVPGRDDEALLDHLEKYCSTHRMDWIVPVDLGTTLLLGRGRDRLKSAGLFPISEPALVERWNDKEAFGRLLVQLGLPTPRTVAIPRPGDRVPGSVGFPAVLKPALGEGGVGVRFVPSPEELSARLPAHGARYGWPLLAQEFIPGRDIDLSALADHGRIVAWTIQQRREGDPDLLDFVENPEVLRLGAELIRRCSFHGIVHFDMRLDDRTGLPVILEANPRMWSSCRHSTWMGVNFPRLGISVASGEDPALRFTPVRGSCRDPGFSVKSTIRGLLRGHGGPEGLSPASQAGWHSHLHDPLPELWRRLKKVGSPRRAAVL